jgi:hypothetical protein
MAQSTCVSHATINDESRHTARESRFQHDFTEECVVGITTRRHSQNGAGRTCGERSMEGEIIPRSGENGIRWAGETDGVEERLKCRSKRTHTV